MFSIDRSEFLQEIVWEFDNNNDPLFIDIVDLHQKNSKMDSSFRRMEIMIDRIVCGRSSLDDYLDILEILVNDIFDPQNYDYAPSYLDLDEVDLDEGMFDDKQLMHHPLNSAQLARKFMHYHAGQFEETEELNRSATRDRAEISIKMVLRSCRQYAKSYRMHDVTYTKDSSATPLSLICKRISDLFNAQKKPAKEQ
jgi:hypothetical protein